MGSVLWIPVIFCAASLGLYMLSVNHPVLEDKSDEFQNGLKFPTTLDEVQNLVDILSAYKHSHIYYVLILFSCAYLFKQTFAIPGSVFMNLLGGAVFGVWIGFPLTCLLSAAGATNCYLLSKYFGKSFLEKRFPTRIQSLQKKIEENMDSLFFFLLFLRLFPMAPNWFMNMTAPVINVPIHHFFLSVFIGLMPYNFICVQTGCILSEISSVNDVLTFATSMKLVLIALVALVPGILVKRAHNARQKAH